jgi:lipoprotein-releasing system permease protein
MRLAYVFTELARRPVRTLTALFSVAVGVALFLSLQAYADGYRAAARAPLAEVGAEMSVRREGQLPETFAGVVLPHSTAPIRKDEIAALRALPGVKDMGVALFFWDFEGDRFLDGLGFDPAQSVGFAGLQAGLREGRFLQADDQGVAVIDLIYAAAQGIAVGDRVTVANRSFAVVGLVDTSRAGQLVKANVYLPLGDARELVRAAPSVRAVHDVGPADANVLFLRTDPLRTASVAAEAMRLLGDRTLATTPQAFEATLGATFGMVDRFGMLVGLAGLLVAVAGLVRTAAAGLWERRRDIGLMRAVGWRRRDIVVQAMAETITVTALGCLSGLGLAQAVAALLRRTRVTVPIPWELSPKPHFLPGGAPDLTVTVPFGAHISGAMALATLGLALGCGAGVSLWLARRAAAMKATEVWRSE